MFSNRVELRKRLDGIREAGLYKNERQLLSPQGPSVRTKQGTALNFCANNYLGLADDPRLVQAAHQGLEQWGYGLSSVRFICGTQELHRRLEEDIARYLRRDDAILFSSCFDANGGIFEALFSAEDTIISDSLNHASLIDGIRLCKAKRMRYSNRDVGELEQCLRDAKEADSRFTVIVTDGVFSMDGYFAPLPQICDLADTYDALVMVDDSHATGFVGPQGRGTAALMEVEDRVDILTGTLGKAIGGASGGYVAAHQEIVDMLRQVARPYLFSNTLAPALVAGSIEALRIARDADEEREHLRKMTERFRNSMKDAGFEVLPGTHPITAVMFSGENGAQEATAIAREMLGLGVYVTAFTYPVVPRGKARIRVQVSAAHSADDVDTCVEAFTVARERI